MIPATIRDIIAMITSVDESIPSPTTARLPAKRPTRILSKARIALPTRAMIEAVFIKFALLLFICSL